MILYDFSIIIFCVVIWVTFFYCLLRCSYNYIHYNDISLQPEDTREPRTPAIVYTSRLPEMERIRGNQSAEDHADHPEDQLASDEHRSSMHGFIERILLL